MSDRPLVIQTEELEPVCAAWLAERCELVRCPSEDPGFEELLARADGLLIRTYTQVNDDLLDRAPNVKVVARAGVSLANIDVAACVKRDVAVVHTPDSNSQAVVEYVLALSLDALRPRVFLDKTMGLTEWKQVRDEMVTPRQLSDLTVGVYGFGRIGSRVAQVFGTIGAKVLGCDLRGIEETHGAEMVSREELCERCDLITVHVDDRPTNKQLLNADAFGRMRSDVVFINASRGYVVDNDALAAFLKAHVGAQALLDVHEPEPFPEDYPLLGVPNAHLSPHLASAAATAKTNMSWVVRDLWKVLSGEEPEYRATSQLGAGR